MAIYPVPKWGDGNFYAKSLYGPPSDFRENTGISLQSVPKLSANPMMPQKILSEMKIKFSIFDSRSFHWQPFRNFYRLSKYSIFLKEK